MGFQMIENQTITLNYPFSYSRMLTIEIALYGNIETFVDGGWIMSISNGTTDWLWVWRVGSSLQILNSTSTDKVFELSNFFNGLSVQ